jgi:hypothetical protein
MPIWHSGNVATTSNHWQPRFPRYCGHFAQGCQNAKKIRFLAAFDGRDDGGEGLGPAVPADGG